MADTSIRPFADGDLAAIAGLLTELGYASPTEQMRPRMARLAASPDRATLVAESGGAVTGMVGVSVAPHYGGDEPAATITSMVVTEAARGKGIGAHLVAAAAAWALGRGASRMSLTSHNRRSRAHLFYLRLGYEETGKRFVKALA